MSFWPKISDMVVDAQAGKTTAVENVKKSLNKIKENKEYGSILAVIEDRAIERAKDIDRRVEKGEEIGRLAGVPFIAKDNFLVYGAETTAGSNILKGFQAPYQATVIEKLESEGAICVAKANLDAFGHGGSTENSDYVTTKNPHDKTRVPGGSSGGSAAAVVLGLAPFALGTDTGGSSRQPASFCGCYGYKPSYGLMSRSGVVAMASSTDTIGTLAMRAEDVAIVADIMAGKDDLDSTTIYRKENGYNSTAADLKGLKIGLIKEHMAEGIDEFVESGVSLAIDRLKQSGATIQQVSLPMMTLSLAAYYIIIPAEVSSNLSRYDGQRYGYYEKSAGNLEDVYNLSRQKGFGDEAKRRIMTGAFVLSSGYYDAYYKKAAKLRTRLINEFQDAFKDFDLLIGPTAPSVALKIGEADQDPLKMYMTDIMNVGASLAGVPAISVPIPVVDSLPVGIQVMAPYESDDLLLAATKSIEEVFKEQAEEK